METFTESLTTYFRGERDGGLLLLAIGAVALVASWWLWRLYRQPLGNGMLILSLLVGLGGTLGGAFLAWRSQRQIDEYPARYRADPVELVSSERARMAKVNANWTMLKISWAVLIVASVLTVLLTTRELWRGVALGLLVVCSVVLTFDVFAEKRALEYTDTLEEVSRSPSHPS